MKIYFGQLQKIIQTIEKTVLTKGPTNIAVFLRAGIFMDIIVKHNFSKHRAQLNLKSYPGKDWPGSISS